MGLIKALQGATGSVLADQWKEFFYCEALSKDILMTKGEKRTTRRSVNTKGSDNIISNGSGIAVADGQCMIIVEQGKVVECCAEPGEYTYDKSTEPSIFTGGLGKGILDTFRTIGKRFTYGADTGKDQRVYYFNTKELVDNKFGTPTPIMFRVVDSKIGLDLDVSLRVSGVYSYRIDDPILFYSNVCGNVTGSFTREEIEGQLKPEFISALHPSIGKLADLELRPNQLAQHTAELEEALNATLSEKWQKLRGLKVVSVALSSVSIPEDQSETIRKYQVRAMNRDPGMAAATLVEAQASAMEKAASNESGAMTGFMGMGMAMNAGGVNAAELFSLNNRQKNQTAPATTVNGQNGSWKCACGNTATGKFCTECGAQKPNDGWICSACGTVNKGKFCSECGAKKPQNEPLYRCDKCGWEPEDPKNPPKFCPECGDRFTDEDRV